MLNTFVPLCALHMNSSSSSDEPQITTIGPLLNLPPERKLFEQVWSCWAHLVAYWSSARKCSKKATWVRQIGAQLYWMILHGSMQELYSIISLRNIEKARMACRKPGPGRLGGRSLPGQVARELRFLLYDYTIDMQQQQQQPPPPQDNDVSFLDNGNSPVLYYCCCCCCCCCVRL